MVSLRPDPSACAVDPGAGRTHLRALGTTVTLAVSDVDDLDAAEAMLRDELEAIDRACSRFRSDSEIWGLYRNGGPVPASPLLYEAVSVACAVAELTGGAVDPTVGGAVEALGYDRDFAEVAAIGGPLVTRPVPAPGWWLIELDDRTRSIAVPGGVRLDLGASAKALVADRAARRIASMTDSGTLVCVGGDISVSGPAPHDGWPVGIAVDCVEPFDDGPVVSISAGGLASSSTVVRSWRRGGRRLHHIVDPATGDCAGDYWRLVSVAATTCVDANAFSTAAVVWGEHAPERLEARGLPSRLVRHDGVEVCVAGWPPGWGDGALGARARGIGRR
jgi:thiamine biosynthesis lipoprotein